MLFNHNTMIKKDGYYEIADKVKAVANEAVDKEIFKEFWQGYTFRSSEIEFVDVKEKIFCIGNPERVDLGDYAYVINVDKNGIFVEGKDEKNLIYGFVTLLDCIMSDGEETVKINCCEICENPVVENRMVHFCVLPETELWELEKFVRISGALKYSHIVIEFWGMFKYDSIKELSWNHGYTKEQLKPIIQTAHDLGMEIIPMFNHWGHATQCMVSSGKHVVLDQNPKLQYLFNENGWCWNIKSDKLKKLLKNVRNELMELFGDGKYFHIGCDEAYGFKYTKDSMKEICDYINEINEDISAHGRKTIMWADMLLYRDKSYENVLYAFAPDKECEKYMMSSLNKNIIMADWQYEAKKAPVETSVVLKNNNFEVVMCPWDRSEDCINACFETLSEHKLDGVLHTTWHTLTAGTPYIAKTAIACWGRQKPYDSVRVEISAVVRKVYFAGDNYEKAGWVKQQDIHQLRG